MEPFLQQWGQAAYTSAGFFWMSMWAFILGYGVSSLIQIFVPGRNLREALGKTNLRSVSLAAFWGFISSSCSFSALATTKTLFKKGASFVSSLSFLLASTNLVIELGILISVFLGWQFVVGEYLGGVLLILVSWLLVFLIRPDKLVKKARENLGSADKEDENEADFKERIRREENWIRAGKQYAMEWKMVWKDVTVGFTLAGIIAAFVPDEFFATLFVGTGESGTDPGFLSLVEHVIVAPLAAFITFIGSMGNIPLAALLFGKGVSFAGVMAFIFSDLVVFPVLRINAKYYGWKMALFILFLLFSALVVTSLGLHYGLWAFDLLPTETATNLLEQSHFKLDYTFFLNIVFLIISGVLIWFGFFRKKEVHHHPEMAPKSKLMEKILKFLAFGCYAWLALGLIFHFTA